VSADSVSASRIAFATAVVGIGVCGLLAADFVAAWQPVPRNVPARELLAYLCAIVCVVAGAGLLFRSAAARSACVLLGGFLLWMIAFRLPAIFAGPTAAVSYESWGECAVMVSATWTILARCADDRLRQRFGFATGERGAQLARWIFGVALIAFGIAHFAYIRDTAALVPSWLPAHVTWVYITGIAYVAAGLGLLTGIAARPAAMLAAVQMGLFTLLVWVPVVAKGHPDLSEWSELLDSWALAAGAWVVADHRPA
jgi:uncharacterized membrane protein